MLPLDREQLARSYAFSASFAVLLAPNSFAPGRHFYRTSTRSVNRTALGLPAVVRVVVCLRVYQADVSIGRYERRL